MVWFRPKIHLWKLHMSKLLLQALGFGVAYNICLKVHDVQCREIADNANTYVCYNQIIRHEGVKKSRCSGWPQIWKGHLD